MTFKETVARYVDLFGDAEDAMFGTFIGLIVLAFVIAGLVSAPLFTLGLLGLIGAGVGLFLLFLWASDGL